MRRAFCALLLIAGCGRTDPPPAVVAGPVQGELIAPVAPSAPSPAGLPADPPPAAPEIPPTPETVEVSAPPPPRAEVKAADGGPEYLPMTLQQLGAFKYEPPVPPLRGAAPPPPRPDPFPPDLKNLDGRKVEISGFMYPLRMERGKIAEFLLMPSILSCCFADRVKMNEFVAILPADGKPIRFLTQVTVRGALEVGEEKDEDGWVMSVYRMKAESIVDGGTK